MSFSRGFSTRRGFSRRRSVILTLGLAALCVAAVSWAQEVREWKSSAGKPIPISKTENLVGALDLSDDSDPTKVTVETAAGKRYKYPLAKLSADDRKYVEAERAKKAAPPEDDFVADPDLIAVEEETRSTRTGGDSTSNSDGRRALAAVPKDGVKRALLVGVDEYAEFADLSFAVADVEAIRERLVALGFKPENIVELKSTSPLNLIPTQRNIDRQIDALLNSAGPNDLLFLHFSGHGFQTNGAVRFAPLDAVATGDEEVVDAETTISLTEIMERLKTSKAKFKWMIIDACRENPTGTRSAAASAKALKNIDPPPGMLVLQSCSEGELSFEDADAGRGLFTGRLLEAFDGKADLDDDGIVSAQEVCKYARDQTLAASKTRFPAPQTPRMSAVDFGDFVVADDLKKDGLTREEWAQAQTLYEEAVKATEAEKYATAQEKIDAALAIVAAVPDANAEKKRYAYQKKIVERFLNLETPASAFKWEFDENGATLCGFKGEALENIVIPAKVDGKPVVAIGYRAFFDCDVLKLVSFPDGLQTIDDIAFYRCIALESVSFPDGLQTIGAGAFEDCLALESVSFPDGLQAIGGSAFNSCIALQSVSFPDGLQTIGGSAFGGCAVLQSFSASATHPVFRVVDGVLFTADGKTLVAYPSGRKAETYRVPDGVETIGAGAFEDCLALESVSFPDGLQTIGDNAFSNCDALQSVSFPDGLQTIGDYAFSRCDALKSVSFPDDLQTIDNRVFYDCKALQSFSASATHPTFRIVDGVLFTADGKTLVAYPVGRKAETYRVPDGVETIGKNAFYTCDALKSVAFPDGLQTIGDSAFYYCDVLKSVSFPDGLQTIGKYAFYCCNALKSVELPRETKRAQNALPGGCEVRVR